MSLNGLSKSLSYSLAYIHGLFNNIFLFVKRILAYITSLSMQSVYSYNIYRALPYNMATQLHSNVLQMQFLLYVFGFSQYMLYLWDGFNYILEQGIFFVLCL